MSDLPKISEADRAELNLAWRKHDRATNAARLKGAEAQVEAVRADNDLWEFMDDLASKYHVKFYPYDISAEDGTFRPKAPAQGLPARPPRPERKR